MTINQQPDADENNLVEKQTIFKEEPPVLEAEKQPTSVGLEENIAGALCYLPLIGLIFFFVEKENKFVRFHALQVIIMSIAITVAAIGVGILTGLLSFMKLGWLGLLISGPFYFLVMPATFFLYIFGAYQAYKGKYFKFPIVGKMAAEHSVRK